jgi:hypothetical protein
LISHLAGKHIGSFVSFARSASPSGTLLSTGHTTETGAFAGVGQFSTLRSGRYRVTDDLRLGITEATQALGQLESLASNPEPVMIGIEKVKAARSELYQLAESRDPEAAQVILKQYIVEMTADSKRKRVEVVLRDPRLFGASCMAAPTGVEPVLRP